MCREVPGVLVSDQRATAYCTYDAAPIVAEITQVDWTAPEVDLSIFTGVERLKEKGIWQKLRKTQKQGIRQVFSKDYGGVFDDMRGGKSFLALAGCKARCANRIMVYCPARVKPAWGREVLKWFGERALILKGRAGTHAQWYGTKTILRDERKIVAALNSARYVISNFDILSPQRVHGASGKVGYRRDLLGWGPLLLYVKFDAVLIDEAHEIGMNWKRDHSQHQLLAKMYETPDRARMVYIITGTPIAGSVARLQPLMQIIAGKRDSKSPNLWDDKPFRFHVRYCDGGHVHVPAIGRDVWQANGSSNESELAKRIEAISVARPRSQLADDLPPLLRESFPIEAEGEVDKYAESMAKAHKFTKKTKARDLTGRSRVVQSVLAQKLPTIVAEVMEVVKTGQKVCILTQFVESASRCFDRVKAATAAHARRKGTTDAIRVNIITSEHVPDPEKRDEVCEAWVAHEGPAIMVASAGSIAGGLSLRGCSEVHVAEIHHEPATMFQAESRGAEAGYVDSIMVRYYYLQGSWDQRRVELIVPKLEYLEKLLDNEDAKTLRRELASDVEQSLDEIIAEALAGAKAEAWLDEGES